MNGENQETPSQGENMAAESAMPAESATEASQNGASSPESAGQSWQNNWVVWVGAALVVVIVLWLLFLR